MTSWTGPTNAFITALRIHVSATTKELLEEFETFNLQERGPIDLKVGDFVLRTKTFILKGIETRLYLKFVVRVYINIKYACNI